MTNPNVPDFAKHRIDPKSSAWPQQLASDVSTQLTVIGDPALLGQSMLGILCSSQCPGAVVMRTFEAMKTIRDQKRATIGGFHSPMEQECLDLLLLGNGPVIICPARGIDTMRIPRKWRPGIEAGRVAVVSPFTSREKRMTARLAKLRNAFVADLSTQVLVPHAAPGSKTEAQILKLLGQEKKVLLLDAGCSTLVAAGAKFVEEHFSA